MEEGLILQVSYGNQRSLLAGLLLPWLTAGGIHLLEGNLVIPGFTFVLFWLSIAKKLD